MERSLKHHEQTHHSTRYNSPSNIQTHDQSPKHESSLCLNAYTNPPRPPHPSLIRASFPTHALQLGILSTASGKKAGVIVFLAAGSDMGSGRPGLVVEVSRAPDL